MIARTWRGRVRPGDAETYARYVAATGFAAYATTPGNRGAWMLTREDGELTEITTFSLWEDERAVRAFAGDDIETPVLYPEDARYLVGATEIVHHAVLEPRPDTDRDGEITRVGDLDVWWDVHGRGAPLVLLHPGGADSRAWDANLPGLARAFRCFRYDRRGQGRSPDPGGPITFDAMAGDAIAFLEDVVGGPAHLAGHSIGAPVGLLVAQRRPDLVTGLVFSEGVFHHDGWLPGVLDPLPADVEGFLGGLYGEVSPHGRAHWPSVWARLDAEHHRAPGLTTGDLAGIATPTLLMFADGESEVRPEHVAAMREALPAAELAVVPGTGHGLPADKPDLCNRLMTDFLLSCVDRQQH